MDSPNRLDWSYLPGRRKGVSLKDMNDAERRAAQAMLRAALSARGYEKAEGVRELEGILRGIEHSDLRDPDLYYVTRLRIALRRDAVGLALRRAPCLAHFSSETGALVSSTPAFFGANPARVPSGPRAGWRLLPAEEDLARQLLASLDQAHAGEAVIATGAPADIILGPGRKSVPEPAGLTYAEMTPPQQRHPDAADRRVPRTTCGRMPPAASAPGSRRPAWIGSGSPGRAASGSGRVTTTGSRARPSSSSTTTRRTAPTTSTACSAISKRISAETFCGATTRKARTTSTRARSAERAALPR